MTSPIACGDGPGASRLRAACSSSVIPFTPVAPEITAAPEAAPTSRHIRSREAATSPGRREPSEKELRGLLDRARSQGRDDELRRDIAMRKAVDLLAAEARPIPAERAEARERLWTPEKDEPAERGRLWTPGG